MQLRAVAGALRASAAVEELSRRAAEEVESQRRAAAGGGVTAACGGGGSSAVCGGVGGTTCGVGGWVAVVGRCVVGPALGGAPPPVALWCSWTSGSLLLGVVAAVPGWTLAPGVVVDSPE